MILKIRVVISRSIEVSFEIKYSFKFYFYFRNEKLSKLNFALREQLEESQRTNESLTNDLQKLACDWQQMRDEMTEKEDEWKEEEQV